VAPQRQRSGRRLCLEQFPRRIDRCEDPARLDPSPVVHPYAEEHEAGLGWVLEGRIGVKGDSAHALAPASRTNRLARVNLEENTRRW